MCNIFYYVLMEICLKPRHGVESTNSISNVYSTVIDESCPHLRKWHSKAKALAMWLPAPVCALPSFTLCHLWKNDTVYSGWHTAHTTTALQPNLLAVKGDCRWTAGSVFNGAGVSSCDSLSPRETSLPSPHAELRKNEELTAKSIVADQRGAPLNTPVVMAG